MITRERLESLPDELKKKDILDITTPEMNLLIDVDFFSDKTAVYMYQFFYSDYIDLKRRIEINYCT